MQNRNKKILIFFFLLLFFLLGANFVYALEVTYPRLPGAAPPQDFLKTASTEDIPSLYVKYIFNLVIWAGGIIALGALIYSGIRYLFSTGKPEAMVSAKDQISAAFFGLLILLSSFLILKTLSPQFIAFKIPGLEPVEIEEKPKIPFPSAEEFKTSIDAEMPFSRVIEKIFERYISEPESEQEFPRMTRIKDDAEATEEITDKLRKQSGDLKSYSDSCRCEILRPDPPCNHYGCYSCPPQYCTSDPCRNVRASIQSTEDKNRIEINNLIAEQAKTKKEVALLKEQLDRLERAEKFITDCPFRSLNSFAQLLTKKDYFDEQKWTIREINFWDDVGIVYLTEWLKGRVYDFATFYCAISGSFEQGYAFSPLVSEEELGEAETIEEADIVISQSMACSSEAPVGEIIDRTKRITRLLISKLETLIEFEKEMYDAVDRLQVLVSKCSSRRCVPRCVCVSCGPDCEYCIEIGCFGNPCPSVEISKQLDEVVKIWQKITDVINGKGSNNTPETIGIIPIIDEIVPEILGDLETTIRYSMKDCVSKNWEQQDRVLLNCSQAIGATAPRGEVIRFCCYPEKWEGEEKIQTVYGDCFEECYLEKGQEEHRKCVRECLNRKAGELGDEDLAYCTNNLNFYCCHAK